MTTLFQTEPQQDDTGLVPLAPVFEKWRDSLPSDLERARAVAGRDRQQRNDPRVLAARLQMYADLVERGKADEPAALQSRYSTQDECFDRAEDLAAMDCEQQLLPDGTWEAGTTPEECMAIWRNGTTVTGGSANEARNRGSASAHTHEDTGEVGGGATLKLSPKDGAGLDVGVQGKSVWKDTDTSQSNEGSGTSQTTNYGRSGGYGPKCVAQGAKAEEATAQFLATQRRNIADAQALQQRTRPPSAADMAGAFPGIAADAINDIVAP